MGSSDRGSLQKQRWMLDNFISFHNTIFGKEQLLETPQKYMLGKGNTYFNNNKSNNCISIVPDASKRKSL